MKIGKPDFFVYCLKERCVFHILFLSSLSLLLWMSRKTNVYECLHLHEISVLWHVNRSEPDRERYRPDNSCLSLDLYAIFLGCHLLLLFCPLEAFSVICFCPSSQPAIVGARGGVCIRNAQCLRPLHTDRTVGRNGRQDLYHLCQNWLLVSYYLPY